MKEPSARRDLLTGDEAICQPAMNTGSIHAQNLCRLADRNQFSGRWLSRRLEAGNVAIPPQAADLVGSEAFSGRCFATLAVQDSSDHFIGIKRGQAAKQRDCIFVGARPHGPELRHGDIQRSNRTAAPAECQMSATFGPLEIKNYFFQQRAQQFLAIAGGGRRRSPHLANIGAEPLDRLELFGCKRAGSLLLPPGLHLVRDGIESDQPTLPAR